MEEKETATKNAPSIHSFHLTYSEEERRQIVLRNIIKMLAGRNIITDINLKKKKNLHKIDEYLEKFLASGTDDLVYSLDVLEKAGGEIKGFKKYAVKFHLQKLTSVSAATSIT